MNISSPFMNINDPVRIKLFEMKFLWTELFFFRRGNLTLFKFSIQATLTFLLVSNWKEQEQGYCVLDPLWRIWEFHECQGWIMCGHILLWKLPPSLHIYGTNEWNKDLCMGYFFGDENQNYHLHYTLYFCNF